MQDLEAIEQQLMMEWDSAVPKRVLEQTVPHPQTDVIARVTLSADRLCNARFRYWFGPSRVDRTNFAVLTCPETRCPRRQNMLAHWRVQVMGERPTREPGHTDADPIPKMLTREVALDVNGTRFFAREAVFTLRLQCPRRVHEPVSIKLTGWDVFNPTGKGLAGGWNGDQPHFKSLDNVREWLSQQATELT